MNRGRVSGGARSGAPITRRMDRLDRLRKIIGFLVALTVALAQLVCGVQPAAADDRGDPGSEGAEVFRGWGFDTCQAPSLSAMRAWRASDYRAVGVYFAGRARACPRQTYLSASWLADADDLGWRMLPIFVGSQSPCVKKGHKKSFSIDDYDPYHQGEEEGHEAADRAGALGIARRSPLYLDMEAYDHRNSSCARTTLSFVRGWSSTVRSRGYLAGFYSSAESGIRHMERARRSGTGGLPDVMWFARWQVPASTSGERVLSRSAWTPHRRIHQYRGNVTETHGGRKITIDRNLVDAPVAIID